jgi:hypothetical protein
MHNIEKIRSLLVYDFNQGLDIEEKIFTNCYITYMSF